MKVRDILTAKASGVRWTRPGASVAMAAHLMRQYGVGALVVSQDGRRLEGLLTEREIAWGLTEHAEELPRRLVRDLMLRSIPTCAPDTPLRTAMAMMTEHRLRHLPVVENGVLEGLVSIGDVVKSRLKEIELETGVLRDAYVAAH
jgi:CBS domain-containing protein